MTNAASSDRALRPVGKPGRPEDECLGALIAMKIRTQRPGGTRQKTQIFADFIRANQYQSVSSVSLFSQ